METHKLLSETQSGCLSSEDAQKLTAWNSPCPSACETPLIELIRRQYQDRPLTKAVCAWDGEMTFEELDKMSGQLATYLVKSGLKPGQFVPICSHKSRWTTIAILGVLKAGCACLLLDPAQPRDRLSRMCTDISPYLILISSTCVDIARSLVPNAVIIQDACTESAFDPDQVADVVVKSSDPSFAVFTSGSTGTPKAVVISQSSLVTMALNTAKLGGLKAEARVLQFASHSFDMSLIETFLCLVAGACLCVPSQADMMSNLPRCLEQFRVTYAFLTPTVARTIPPDEIGPLQTLAMTGEAITQGDIDRWPPHLSILGAYGPAECMIVSICPDLRQAASATELGTFISGVGWVTDPENPDHLLPIGTDGELLIEGPGVGSGYLNRPQRTAESFIEAPSWLATPRSSRLYRTGDIVRYGEKGSIEYRGRKDNQVKLRGQRIELGEIETHVRECLSGSIEDAVADVVAVHGGSKALFVSLKFCNEMKAAPADGDTLFLTTTSWQQKCIDLLKLRLQDRIPQYMIPQYYFSIVTVPMTATLKTNRRLIRDNAEKHLSESTGLCRESTVPNIAPTTASETLLQRLWGEILGKDVATISVQHNWFDVGGDSLLAMQLVHHASKGNLFFTYADVLRCRTLSALAAIATHDDSCTDQYRPFQLLRDDWNIKQDVQRKYGQDASMIEDIYPCTAAQQYMVHESHDKQVNYTAQINFKLNNSPDTPRLAAAWDRVVSAHPTLRTHVVEITDRGYFQVVMREGCHLGQQLSSLPSEKPDIWAFKSPLACLLGRADSWTMLLHHVVYDGASLAIIFRDLERAYNGELLPMRPFASFVQWLVTRNSQCDEYWKSLFAGFHGITYPRLPSPSYEPQPQCFVQKRIPLTQSTFHGCTLDSAFRLAFSMVLSWSFDDQDLVFGVVFNRRNIALHGVTQVAGPTVAGLPVRVQLDHQATLRQALVNVHDEALDMIPYLQADHDYLGDLSINTAAARQYQTLLVIQPDADQSFPPLFSPHEVKEDSHISIGLMLVAQVRSQYVDLLAISDEQLVDGARLQQIADLIGVCLDQIGTSPCRLVREVVDGLYPQ